MRVLVACEYSGVVRDAFAAKGHYALSCDLLPTEKQGNHYQGDVFDIISDGWDLMIAHPPCTFLTVSGNAWLKNNKTRYYERLGGAKFFIDLAFANIERIAIENPIGVMSGFFRRPDQIIQPWMFGDDASKQTCLWLKNIPILLPTHSSWKKIYSNQTPSGQNKLGPSPERAKLRSKTYPGIATAMAEQWNF
jgi:hypothetical protein